MQCPTCQGKTRVAQTRRVDIQGVLTLRRERYCVRNSLHVFITEERVLEGVDTIRNFGFTSKDERERREAERLEARERKERQAEERRVYLEEFAKKNAEIDSLLGKMLMREIATKLDVSIHRVKHRAKLQRDRSRKNRGSW